MVKSRSFHVVEEVVVAVVVGPQIWAQLSPCSGGKRIHDLREWPKGRMIWILSRNEVVVAFGPQQPNTAKRVLTKHDWAERVCRWQCTALPRRLLCTTP